MLQDLVALQGLIRETISGYLAAYREGGDLGLLAAMLPAGVLFGAVHALTPGHSKLLLAGYVAGSRIAALRAVAVAAALAATHVGMSVVIAWFGLPLVTRTLGGAGEAPLLEAVSRGLMLLIGLWFIISALKPPRPHADHGPLAGIAAGLVPCPLTLFVMTLALARGIPEAGLAFAAAMLIGVGCVLVAVAVGSALLRRQIEGLSIARGGSIERAGRTIQLLAGLSILLIAVVELS